MINRIHYLILFFFLTAGLQAKSIRVLFLGNSYTYVNSLPQLTADVASSVMDTVIFNQNTIGGYTLQQHLSDATSIGLIQAGNWDYVVLQEQSQLPSFPIAQVEQDVFPYAHLLDSIIDLYNPCGRTVFYMTWGRKNGDASNCAFYPPLCTYQGMDSLLNLRYRMMADSNDALVSPVGAVWHYIRDHDPLIELYQADESHPSAAGSYAAACCFYTCLFRKDPMNISYDFSLSAADADSIRRAVKAVVFDSLPEWNIGKFDPHAFFSDTTYHPLEISFGNQSSNADSYLWDFGDGNASADFSPTHLYAADGIYTVVLHAYHCDQEDSFQLSVNVQSQNGIQDLNSAHAVVYPNPSNDHLNLDQLELNSGNTDLEIREQNGRLVSKFQISSQTRSIDISELKPGVYYLLNISNNKSQYIARFIR